MIYKFKCKVAGDVIMLAPAGDALMRVLGRDPAAKGIIEVDHMLPSIEAIQQAIVADEAERAQAESEALAKGGRLPPREGITPRQRLWPMVEMLRRAHDGREPIVWGV